MSTELVERFVRGVRIHLSGGTPCMALPGYHDDWNAPRDLSTWYNQHLGGLSGLSEAEQDSCRSALVDILHRRDARALQLFEVTRQLLLPEECLDIFLSQEARDHTEDLWGLANAVHWGVASGVLAWSESWRPMVLDGARRQRVWLYL